MDAPTEADRPASTGRSVPRSAQTVGLEARLRQIAPHLGVAVESAGSEGSAGGSRGSAGGSGGSPAHPPAAGGLAAHIASTVRQSRRDADLWLAIVGFTAVFPTIDEHAAVRRSLSRSDPADTLGVLAALLEGLAPIIRRSPAPEARIEVVANAVVIDATFSGRSDHNTGVQRVLRETASRWNADRELTLVCWNEEGTAMRRLAGREVDRVVDWANYSSLSGAERVERAFHGDVREVVVVPVSSVVVEIEVAQLATAAPLAALAAVSGNGVAIVGHDAIPIVSAQSQDPGEIERFARFLTVVKHSARVAGVSASAATEYAGFVDAVRAQGLPGPAVTAVPLAMNPPTALPARPAVRAAVRSSVGTATEGWPLVLVVGSQEPRKNHSAIVFAAGQLWEAGIRFRLRFIGGGSGPGIAAFDAELRPLQKKGVAIEVLRGTSDAVLLDSYREARFTVFPSLHEGFGLPVAESLALGVPVITSNHGSLQEAAEGGGCLTVDARDDEAVRFAMERLLTDDELYSRLRAEAERRSFRTWNDYAAELWSDLVVPVQQALGADAAAAAEHPEPPAPAEPVPSATLQLALDTWFQAARADIATAYAKENSRISQAKKVVPLARFFVARSREMGVGPASQAAWKVVRRRLVGS
ncbi:glycosyltransferase [Subtercola boreus]|uniref:glycosyltransferase n=1 Tax=Subtercola boreus TaxID=120213 RepID=UPI0011C0505F|nr:glycosyltransferase [Subtercola boreus]